MTDELKLTDELKFKYIICGLFTFCLSYLIYYMSMNSVYTLIMYLHASYNLDYVNEDYNEISLQVIIGYLSFFYFMNFLQTIIIACKISFHILSINLCIHKYILVYLYLGISQDGCGENTYLNCNENINTTIIDHAKIYITYGIISFIISELFFIMATRCKVYYFSPNICKEIILSFLFYNLISLLYISVFCICCLLGGCSSEDSNGFDLSKINDGFSNKVVDVQAQLNTIDGDDIIV